MMIQLVIIKREQRRRTDTRRERSDYDPRTQPRCTKIRTQKQESKRTREQERKGAGEQANKRARETVKRKAREVEKTERQRNRKPER